MYSRCIYFFVYSMMIIDRMEAKIMKTRKQGNAIVLTVPTKFGIEENVEYIAVKGEDDTITFIKKKKNIFDEAFENDETINASAGFPEDSLVGKEII